MSQSSKSQARINQLKTDDLNVADPIMKLGQYHLIQRISSEARTASIGPDLTNLYVNY